MINLPNVDAGKQLAKNINSQINSIPSKKPATIPKNRLTSFTPGTNPSALISLSKMNIISIPTTTHTMVEIP